MICPVCGKPGEKATAPFCARRCADVDLARWLRGDYAIPGPEIAPESASESDLREGSRRRHG
ncbi:MAG: DNA gyrase inhibitor YacG [Rhodobacteraceae bacterium]|nr:DNA gyrase inhibitor YacG [Paracoccaceae bacterium]